MPTIEIETSIRAPIERVFDLCRSIDAHVATAKGTGEEVVGGVTSGLLDLGDEVTWSARHLGRRWQLTSRITEFDRPNHFRDTMIAGVFKRFDHDHCFAIDGQSTQVKDVFDFTSPYGPIGMAADKILIVQHMHRFLEQRMQAIKSIAESERWRDFLPQRLRDPEDTTPQVTATITFLRTEDGGRQHPPNTSMYRPHVVVGDPKQRRALVDGENHGTEHYVGVRFSGEARELSLGVPHEVTMDLVYHPSVNYDAVLTGATFTIREGAWVVGFGEVLDDRLPRVTVDGPGLSAR